MSERPKTHQRLASSIAPSNTFWPLMASRRLENLLRTTLEQGRFSVDLAGDGVEAWQMLQNITYDCILLDLKMPRMNGQKLYQLIQGSSEALADKVIFMSGDTVTSTTYDFVSSTGNRLLNKPFQIADLRTQVGQLIKQSGDQCRTADSDLIESGIVESGIVALEI